MKIIGIKKVLIFMLMLSMLTLSGCIDNIEVDEMVYVVAMGIDEGTNGNLRITLFMVVPIAVGVGPEPGEVEKATNIIVVEAPTILGGINVVNSIISKEINFSHAKLIVISKQLAEKGVERFLNTFMRYREFRPDTYLGISMCSADEVLTSLKPILEINPAKHIELLMEAFQYTGFSNGSTIGEFYTRMECTCNEAIAILLDSSKIEDEKDLESMLSNKASSGEMVMEGDYEASDMPILYESKSRQMGSAVFIRDNMVGELTGRETNYYLMVSGQLGAINYTLPDPNKKSNVPYRDYISIRLSQARKPEINIKVVDEKPIIKIKVSLEGDIISITGKEDYSTGERLTELEEYASDYIYEEVSSFLIKTRDEFKSDVCATGRSIKKKFLLWDDWMDFSWPEKYENAEFDLEVSVRVRRSGIMVKHLDVEGLLKGEKK